MNMFESGLDDLVPGASHESPRREITQADVAVFAALTGDHHPAHVDPEWASTGPFGRPIAHGLLTLSCAAGNLPLDPERALALRRVREAVFKRPLAVGDTIAVRCTVVSSRPIDDRTGLVDCELRITDSASKLVARAVLEILWARDPEATELDAVRLADDGFHVYI